MITAKDIFTMEREMMAHAQYLLYQSDIPADEKEEIAYGLDDMTEGEWDELQKRLSDRQISPLDRLKNGELLKSTELNLACLKAINRNE
jgi:hypothetical protein